MASKNTELKREQEAKAEQAFIDDIRAVEEKHGYRVEPIMHYTANGILLRMVAAKKTEHGA